MGYWVDLSNHKKFKIALIKEFSPCASDCNPVHMTDDTAELLQLALESAGAGVWELDLGTMMVRLSALSICMFGLPETHSGIMSRQEFLKLTDERDAERLKGWVPPLIAKSVLNLNEFCIQRPDGETYWLRATGRYLTDQTGRPTKLVGLLFDDTVRKLAEEAVRVSEERFRLVQEAALIGTFVSDENLKAVGSRQFYRNLGLPEDTDFLDNVTYMDLVHPDDRERVKRETLAAMQSADHYDIECRIRSADTCELRWIFARSKVERDDSGRLIRIVGAHLDITETKRAKAALHESIAFNRSITEASADCVKLIDLDGRLLFMNKHGLEALEIEDGLRLLGKKWSELLPREERSKVEMALKDACSGQTGHFNAGCPTATGKPKWWDVVVTPICDEQGHPRQLLAISRDITEHRNNLAEIRWTASHDMLTELPNRRYFQDRLENALACAADQGSNVGLLQLDVDDFKQINDALGHDAGDALLKTFTQRLQKAIRSNEMVARLGGDEFAIIVPNLTDSRPLSSIVEDIQAELAQPFVYQGRVFDCRASIGKAIYPQHGATADALLKSSDIALYAAKTSGRGQVRGFHPSMRANMHKRLEMIDRARAALKDDMIFPFYQPKIHFGTGAPAGFEALLRVQAPNMKVQLPAAIAAAFEDLDVAQALSERMQLRVLADMRRWTDDGVDFGHVAINASAAEFRQNDFAERLLNRVKAAGLPTSQIELEVTETVFLGRGAEYVDRALKLLSTEGMRIALDDFGTGYASLSHLKQFPVDVIKIDQSFVRNINVDSDDSAIIKALIGLGKSLSIRIVAEGIENHAQSAFLSEHGCDYGQGYLFSRAVAAAEVPDLISRLRKGPARYQQDALNYSIRVAREPLSISASVEPSPRAT
jgi:diguanylate cyclase (GGDEF)-like protein/PAS domain S-box-containing protein